MSPANHRSLITAAIEISITPIATIESLPNTIFQFQRLRLSTRPTLPVISAVKDILPYCSVNAPLSEHCTYVLHEVCDGFRGLVVAATTLDGQEELARSLDDQKVAADVAEFWKTEYILE